jgi:ArsR family transcriptional regulator
MAIIKKDSEITLVASRINAIAHPIRLAIVCQLAEGRELCVGEIMAAVHTTQPNASQHLRHLADQELLSSRKEGNRVIYWISDRRLAAILGMVRAVYCDSRTRRRW